MKFFIPTIGTAVKLIQPWNFKLIYEYRNQHLWNILKLREPEYKGLFSGPKEEVSHIVTLPIDTILIVDRIYIRQNASDFDSISFKAKNELGKFRFWAKLDDVNKIEFKIFEKTQKIKKYKYDIDKK